MAGPAPPLRAITLPCGGVTVLQPARGATATTDSLLLAAVLPTSFAGHAVDLGCGPGTVAFRVAARCPAAHLTAIDCADDLVAAANKALARPDNAAFAGRVRVLAGDVAAPGGWADEGCADAVLFNPPFFVSGEGRPSPDPARNAARRMPPGGLAAWFCAAHHILVKGGAAAAIMPPARLAEALAAEGFGAAEVTPIYPRPGEPAHRILLVQRKERRTAPTLTAPLILADAAGRTPGAIAALIENRISLTEALRPDHTP